MYQVYQIKHSICALPKLHLSIHLGRLDRLVHLIHLVQVDKVIPSTPTSTDPYLWASRNMNDNINTQDIGVGHAEMDGRCQDAL